jgi:hypothetical protein
MISEGNDFQRCRTMGSGGRWHVWKKWGGGVWRPYVKKEAGYFYPTSNYNQTPKLY